MMSSLRTVIVLSVGLAAIAALPSHAGDAAAGRDKSFPCLACHGAEGISDHYKWPNIAGQSEGYLVKQMRDFRDGARYDPWMSPMARPLSDEDIDDLAAYYAALPSGASDGPLPDKARTCVACHREEIAAVNPLWPTLAGQHRRYLVKQMRDYRDGQRQDPVMAPMAAPLSDQDIEELAAYYAGL